MIFFCQLRKYIWEFKTTKLIEFSFPLNVRTSYIETSKSKLSPIISSNDHFLLKWIASVFVLTEKYLHIFPFLLLHPVSSKTQKSKGPSFDMTPLSWLMAGQWKSAPPIIASSFGKDGFHSMDYIETDRNWPVTGESLKIFKFCSCNVPKSYVRKQIKK